MENKDLLKLAKSLEFEHNIRVDLKLKDQTLPLWAIKIIHESCRHPEINFKYK